MRAHDAYVGPAVHALQGHMDGSPGVTPVLPVIRGGNTLDRKAPETHFSTHVMPFCWYATRNERCREFRKISVPGGVGSDQRL